MRSLSTMPTKHRLSNNHSMTYGFIDLFPEAGRKTNIGVVTTPRVTSTAGFIAPEVSCPCFNSFVTSRG